MRVELARVLLLAGRASETAPLLAEEYRRGTPSGPVALEAARIHLACGRLGEATTVLEQLARTEPSNPWLHLLLSRTMRRRGDMQRALRHTEVASRLAADLPGLQFEAALVGLSRGYAKDARGLLEKELDARGLPQDRVDVLEVIGALLACGLSERADKGIRARFGHAIHRTHADDAEVLRLAARVALERGDLRTGRALSRRLLRIEPGSIVAIHNLALVSLTRRRFGPAWEWIRRGRAIDAGDLGIKKLRSLWVWKRLMPWPVAPWPAAPWPGSKIRVAPPAAQPSSELLPGGDAAHQKDNHPQSRAVVDS